MIDQFAEGRHRIENCSSFLYVVSAVSRTHRQTKEQVNGCLVHGGHVHVHTTSIVICAIEDPKKSDSTPDSMTCFYAYVNWANNNNLPIALCIANIDEFQPETIRVNGIESMAVNFCDIMHWKNAHNSLNALELRRAINSLVLFELLYYKVMWPRWSNNLRTLPRFATICCHTPIGDYGVITLRCTAT